jgi:hypothetical protein
VTAARATAPVSPPAVAEAAGDGRRYGKRRVSDRKDKFIAVRCTAARHAAYEAAAAQVGLSVGAYLRFLADGTAGPRAVRRPPVERAELARLLGELGKIGSNVNQLSRAFHTTGDLPAWSELAAIGGEVRAMRDAVMKALGRGD